MAVTDAVLRALCDAATPGPWEHVPNANVPKEAKGALGSIATRDDDYIAKIELDGPNPEADAKFIAAARTAIPDLLDRIATLTAQRDQAAAEEREACAKVVEKIYGPWNIAQDHDWNLRRWREAAAASVRERGVG